jgi:DNA (cytosine-5)-methyltransferase 1
MSYKILNLYACLGGNRYKWDNCEVTAIEIDPVLAKLYKERFNNDIVIITDAHQYLLDHYQEFDFIWSSPPCPTHSKARFARHQTTIDTYPDLKLYEEIIFLKYYFKGKFCIENVIPFYKPLIPAKKIGRHLYWTNFLLPNELGRKNNIIGNKDEIKLLSEFHEYDFTKYKGDQRIDKIARNLVDFEAGKTILNVARNIQSKTKLIQQKLF